MSRKRDSLKDLALAPSPTYDRPTLRSLQYAQPSSVQLRDGDVVVFRRADSPLLCLDLASLTNNKYNVHMNSIKFDWDPSKAATNQKKHKVSFEEAKSAFYDERAKLIDDPDHSADEERFILLGLSHLLRVVVVCHCYRGDDNVIRIISARKATTQELKAY